MRLEKIFSLLSELCVIKTLYFNIRYFSLRTALHLPVFIYKGTDLQLTRGRIELLTKPQPGLIKIGIPGRSAIDRKGWRTKWKVEGTFAAKETATFGRGCCIRIGRGAKLTVGRNLIAVGKTDFICMKEITLGNDSLISWDGLIMDSDQHEVMDLMGNNVVNKPRPIVMGEHVWIGCRCTILKGVTITDNVIVSACSTITKSILQRDCAVAGHGREMKDVKQNIGWRH